MVVKLYEKLDNQWYFSRLGEEHWLGFEVSKVLSFFSTSKENKVFYIKCVLEKKVLENNYPAFFRITRYPEVWSDVFKLFYSRNCIELPIMSIPDKRWYVITKIW